MPALNHDASDHVAFRNTFVIAVPNRDFSLAVIGDRLQAAKGTDKRRSGDQSPVLVGNGERFRDAEVRAHQIK
jgi:hypothetical protein